MVKARSLFDFQPDNTTLGLDTDYLLRLTGRLLHWQRPALNSILRYKQLLTYLTPACPKVLKYGTLEQCSNLATSGPVNPLERVEAPLQSSVYMSEPSLRMGLLLVRVRVEAHGSPSVLAQ